MNRLWPVARDGEKSLRAPICSRTVATCDVCSETLIRLWRLSEIPSG
jgi:hypothetical protein